ncbi:helix-turn-helix domain-containing protein [Faecalibacillus intestinalis]|uniref:helix-turn-helix domain-containing protein n=1 Tax=Faecalibacillus intestinalis TaxID=1982626 RepID=UPI0039996F91
MGYDYKKEYIRWKQWKENEEKILRKHHVDELTISDLRKFDLAQFNAERSFKRHQNVTKDIFFTTQPIYDKKEINNIDDILDEIESESLFEYLKKVDPVVLNIIELKIKGYNINEISQILGISISSIYRRIKKVKKFLKK